MKIHINAGREKSLLRRHPWVFSSAIKLLDEAPASGATVELISSEGLFLARASYSPISQIRARVWTFIDEPVDKEFFRRKIKAAIAQRLTLNVQRFSNAYRLIHAESDGIPGLIVDCYNDVLVLQSLTAGSEFWKEVIAYILIEETGIQNIYERSDADVRELEGLKPITGILRGVITNPQLQITEHELLFQVNIATGHKTGFYLDQCHNRHRVGEFAKDRDVLNCFCYTGGFSIHALAG
ncbi:class I SAM-dependent rRNA methyltransferase, partial [bacterium]|nr:class I SAM-dependent rRNA methyltransferase [bacterium]